MMVPSRQFERARLSYWEEPFCSEWYGARPKTLPLSHKYTVSFTNPNIFKRE